MTTNKKNPGGALALLNAGLDKGTLAKLQAGVVVEIKLLDSIDTEVAARRIIIGLALLRIKATLKHGQWLPWFKKNVIGTGYRTCAYAMRLAEVFLEEAQPAKADLAALPTDTVSLATIDHRAEAKKFLKALKGFVGERSFAELLDEHELRDAPKLGGARGKAAAAAPAQPDEEQLYLFARDEIGGVLQRAEELLVKENQLQYLARQPAEVRGVVESLRALADKVEAAAKPILAQKAG